MGGWRHTAFMMSSSSGVSMITQTRGVQSFRALLLYRERETGWNERGKSTAGVAVESKSYLRCELHDLLVPPDPSPSLDPHRKSLWRACGAKLRGSTLERDRDALGPLDCFSERSVFSYSGFVCGRTGVDITLSGS